MITINDATAQLKQKLGIYFTPLYRIMMLNTLAIDWLVKIDKNAKENPAILSEMIPYLKRLLNHPIVSDNVIRSMLFFEKALHKDDVYVDLQDCYNKFLLDPVVMTDSNIRENSNILDRQNDHALSVDSDLFTMLKNGQQHHRKELILALIADLHRCHAGLLVQIESVQEDVLKGVPKIKQLEMTVIDNLSEIHLAKLFCNIIDPGMRDLLAKMGIAESSRSFDPSIIIGLCGIGLELYLSSNKSALLAWKMKEILLSCPTLVNKVWNAADNVSNIAVNGLERVTPLLFHSFMENFRLDKLSRIAYSEMFNNGIGLVCTMGIAAVVGAPLMPAVMTYVGADLCGKAVNWFALDKKAIGAVSKLTGWNVTQAQTNGINAAMQVGARILGNNFSSRLGSRLYGCFFPPESRVMKRPDPIFVSEHDKAIKQKQIEMGFFDNEGVVDQLRCKVEMLKHHPDKIPSFTSEEQLVWEAIATICSH